MARRHSKPPRGLTAFEDPAHEPKIAGRFGRLFPADDDQLDAALLTTLAATMVGDGPDKDNSAVDIDFEDENHNHLADGKTLRLTSGYTYLGQFIDHDLTFDPTSTLEADIDPTATVNFRSPRFDLDCLYGTGPDDQPYMYADDGLHLLEGTGGDVLRYGQRALIGDPRNDENHIVVQWHRIMVRFHNRVVDWISRDPSIKNRFAEAQRLVRWTYQWLIVNDFLPRILRTADWKAMLSTALAAKKAPLAKAMTTRFDEPFVPVEFSGAAYRFGHSMVRPSYHLNDSEVRLRDGGHDADGGNRVPIFDLSEPNLNGFRPFAQPFSTVPLLIEWKYFYHFADKDGVLPTARDARTGDSLPVVQPSYRIDTSLTEPLARLDIPGVANNPPSLAERNLQRSRRLRLPSGQKVAAALGLTPLSKAELLLEKLPDLPADPRRTANNELVEKRTTDLTPAGVDAVAAHTPLWYYLLAEAQMQEDAASLGKMGTVLVGGTFLALLFGDKESYLHKDPGFDPVKALHFDKVGLKLETVADLIFAVAPESVGRMGVLNV